MANNGIKEIKVSNTNYLIEPTLYTSAALESDVAYVATLNNFELFTGVAVNILFTADVVANATLNINSTGAKNIKYANANIKADVLLENHIYTFVYNGTNWVLIGEVGSGTYLPLTGGTVTGDLILKTSSGDSPKITFLRGDTNTNNNNSLVDWTVYDKAGVLTFYSDYTNNMNKSIVEFYAAGAKTSGILPGDDAIYSLGSSGRKWSDVYATTFHGTATRATADASGNEIASTYAKLASPAFTGTPTAPTAADNTNNTQIATTAFVMSAFKANDAMLYKGVVNTNSDLPATHSQGWTYKVGTAGEYVGIQCEVGDMIICNTDGTAANNAHWNVI